MVIFLSVSMIEKLRDELLEGYPEEDLDFVEQVLLVVADPEAKKDIFR